MGVARRLGSTRVVGFGVEANAVVEKALESAGVGVGACATVRTLVVSQHEAVRRHLVAYLGRSPSLSVAGVPFSVEAILLEAPAVVVLDLSQLLSGDLPSAIEAVERVGGRLIALASIGDASDQDLVRGAGGVYQLKAAGAHGLAETVRELASRGPASP
jgi:hypothetical protein